MIAFDRSNSELLALELPKLGIAWRRAYVVRGDRQEWITRAGCPGVESHGHFAVEGLEIWSLNIYAMVMLKG